MHVHGVTLSISTIFYRNGLTDHRESMQIVDQGVTSNVGDILMRLRKRAYQIHVEQKSDF